MLLGVQRQDVGAYVEHEKAEYGEEELLYVEEQIQAVNQVLVVLPVQRHFCNSEYYY